MILLTAIKIVDVENYYLIFWSGSINDTRLRLDSCVNGKQSAAIEFHSVLAFDDEMKNMYCCCKADIYQVKMKKWNG